MEENTSESEEDEETSASSVASDDENGSSDDEDIVGVKEAVSDPKRIKISTVPQVSFHKIAIRNDLFGLSSEAAIEKIITKYNNKNKTRQYLKETSSKIDEINHKNCLNGEQQFQIMVYTQRLGGSPRLLENYGIVFQQRYFHAVIFHYKSDCVYAVTKGSGWRLIQSYVDYDFPSRVAARILSEKGRMSFVDKQLLGNARSTNTILKSEEPTDPFALAAFCTKFTARLRSNASILKLKCFENISNSSTSTKAKQPADIKVEIGLGSVRFKTEFEVEDFPQILEHLNKIRRGDKTFTTDGNNEEESKAFYCYLQKAPQSKQEKLNLALVERIREGIQNHKLNRIHFDVCHKYIDEFSYGSEFTLKYKNRTVKSFSTAPSLESVLTNLQTNEKCKALNKSCPTEIFRKKLSSVKISYKKTNGETVSEKLLNYIEGNILYKDKVYWRAMTKWFYVSEDYLKLVQKSFVDLLNKHLMDRNEPGQLLKPWKNNDKEKVYNESYASENGFIVGDRILVKNIELFDLMLYIPKSNSTFLYHVKKDFGQSTRIACSQVINCVNVLCGSIQRNPPKPDIIEEFYKEYMKNRKSEELPDFMSTLDKFREVLERPTFVYAVASNDKLRPETSQLPIEHYYKKENERKANRSLHLEKKIKDKIFAKDIASLLKERGEEFYKEIANSLCVTDDDDDKMCHILGQKIADELKKENYTGLEGEVTSKLLYCSKENFKLSYFQGKSKSSQNGNIFNLLSPYRSFFDSLSAKLEVLRTRNELAKYGFDNQFKICEITSID